MRSATKPSAVPDEDDFLLAYLRSMPPSYRTLFDEAAVVAHAAIVERRGMRAAHVETWRELPERTVAICVVADDRPGFLSRVSAALVAHDMDVVAAQAYCRTRADASMEAVDLFWIRRMPNASRAPSPIRAHDVGAIGDTLDALVRGRASFDGAVKYATALRKATGAVRVKFEDARDGGTVLTLQARDRPGLLLRISKALFAERVQIVRSEVSTRDGVVLDTFTLTELDGAPLRKGRRLALQTAVLAALAE
jgi:[protein-PII] uridylyltransferase